MFKTGICYWACIRGCLPFGEHLSFRWCLCWEPEPFQGKWKGNRSNETFISWRSWDEEDWGACRGNGNWQKRRTISVHRKEALKQRTGKCFHTLVISDDNQLHSEFGRRDTEKAFNNRIPRFWCFSFFCDRWQVGTRPHNQHLQRPDSFGVWHQQGDFISIAIHNHGEQHVNDKGGIILVLH